MPPQTWDDIIEENTIEEIHVNEEPGFPAEYQEEYHV